MNSNPRALRRLLGTLGISLAAASPALADTVTITANQHASWAVEANGYYFPDNTMRSYYNPSGCNFSYCGPFHVDSFLKFDLGAIPDNATITGVSLTANVATNYNNNSQSEVYESFFDAWLGTSGGPSVTHDSLLGTITGGMGWNTWSLDSGAASWAMHLADNTLTLALHNPSNAYSFLYFSGAGEQAFAPYLTLTYEVAAPVPEPETYAMLLAGLGLLGLARRRRGA